ncbi:hypothetical protein ACJRO7_035641 [Eucalyptus globulus]|uniref:Uncharacterized protein n=1 Tax=Eucalyptus globulus TaxID=34317 RepID=A0ABD3JH24_EUCGL
MTFRRIDNDETSQTPLERIIFSARSAVHIWGLSIVVLSITNLVTLVTGNGKQAMVGADVKSQTKGPTQLAVKSLGLEMMACFGEWSDEGITKARVLERDGWVDVNALAAAANLSS